MRTHSNTLISTSLATIAMVFTLAAAGCDRAPQNSSFDQDSSFDDVRYFNTLKTEKFVLGDQKKLDFSDLIAAAPEAVAITHGETGFDEKSGATKISDIRITAKDNPDAGIHIEQLTLWGVDTAAIKARMIGERLDETILVVARLEAENTSVFGLDTFIQPMLDSVNGALGDAVLEHVPDGEDLANSPLVMPKQVLKDYDINIGKLVLSDLSFDPWVLDLKQISTANPLTPEEQITSAVGITPDRANVEAWHMFQKFAAWSHAHSYTNWAVYDTRLHFTMEQDGLPMSMTMQAPLMAYKGYRQGDLDYAVMHGMTSTTDMKLLNDPNDKTSAPLSMSLDSEYGFQSYEQIRMAKALNHMARGVMPARTDTDFMSLGKWRGKDTLVKMNGQDLYSLDSFYIDMSQFHWLIPNRIDIQMDNLAYNFSGLSELIKQSMEDLAGNPGAGSMSAEEVEIFDNVIAVLKNHDLDVLSMDFHINWDWQADNGDTQLRYMFGMDKLIRSHVEIDGKIPDYESLMSVMPEDYKSFDEDAITQLLEQTLNFDRLMVKYTDEGGLERLFAIIPDMAKSAPNDDPSLAFLKHTPPQQLRDMASGSVLFAIREVNKTFPAAADYIRSASAFIAKGGALTLTIEPADGMSKSTFDNMEEDFKNDPDKIVETLGLSVVHTPPKSK